jgi:hypothetical protein
MTLAERATTLLLAAELLVAYYWSLDSYEKRMQALAVVKLLEDEGYEVLRSLPVRDPLQISLW